MQDRSLYEDPEIFAKYLHGLGNMDDRELDLYFEYFNRLNRDLPRPDLIFMLEVPEVSILLNRIRIRGRMEESGIDTAFLAGLNAYYSTFPQVCRRKHGIPIYQISVAETDIRTPEGKRDFLKQVESAFKECARARSRSVRSFSAKLGYVSLGSAGRLNPFNTCSSARVASLRALG